jgi:hypothetical protein
MRGCRSAIGIRFSHVLNARCPEWVGAPWRALGGLELVWEKRRMQHRRLHHRVGFEGPSGRVGRWRVVWRLWEHLNLGWVEQGRRTWWIYLRGGFAGWRTLKVVSVLLGLKLARAGQLEGCIVFASDVSIGMGGTLKGLYR